MSIHGNPPKNIQYNIYINKAPLTLSSMQDSSLLVSRQVFHKRAVKGLIEIYLFLDVCLLQPLGRALFPWSLLGAKTRSLSHSGLHDTT